MVRRWRLIGYFPILYNPAARPPSRWLLQSAQSMQRAGGGGAGEGEGAQWGAVDAARRVRHAERERRRKEKEAERERRGKEKEADKKRKRAAAVG